MVSAAELERMMKIVRRFVVMRKLLRVAPLGRDPGVVAVLQQLDLEGGKVSN
jgi:hypothetical protein